MSGAQNLPASLGLTATGVTSSQTFVHKHVSTTEIRLTDTEEPGRTLLWLGAHHNHLSVAMLGIVELDAPACRHLAGLLAAKADELEAAVAEAAS